MGKQCCKIVLPIDNFPAHASDHALICKLKSMENFSLLVNVISKLLNKRVIKISKSSLLKENFTRSYSWLTKKPVQKSLY